MASEAQKRAANKYMEDKVQIKITVTPEQRQRYQDVAYKVGKSLTRLITEYLDSLA